MGKFRTRIKQAFDEKSPNSLVLRFTCKASFGSFSSTLVLFCTVCVFCKLLAFRENEKNCRVETQLGVSTPLNSKKTVFFTRNVFVYSFYTKRMVVLYKTYSIFYTFCILARNVFVYNFYTKCFLAYIRNAF